VDSVAGSDTNNGSSETTAWQSPANIAASCTIVKFKRGSEFAVAKGKYAVDLMTLRNIKTLTNYGDVSLPLPKFIKAHEVSSGGMLASYMGGVTGRALVKWPCEPRAVCPKCGAGSTRESTPCLKICYDTLGSKRSRTMLLCAR